jgi:hypothetical protein
LKEIGTPRSLARIMKHLGKRGTGLHEVWGYMSATATPLHPNPQDVPSVTHSASSPKWADAVAQGRQIVRAGPTEQNLPGLSMAVGVGGDIVWAEGFWLGGSRETGTHRARNAVQDRHRLHSAHFGRGRPAP